MPSFAQRKGSSGSCDSYSRRSSESCGSQSTAPTSICTNPGASEGHHSKSHMNHSERDEDLAPNTSVHARSSVDTYASTNASGEDLPLAVEEEHMRDHDYDYIPPLPRYRHEFEESNVRPSTPKDFAQLFPSMNRLSIRHDDFTSDGNMNLRVDTDAPGKRRTAVQLFHLRMYDLAKREFSLRRYCRESGREVCNSKRKYIDPASADRPNIQRSVSSAMKAMAKPQSKRSNSSSSSHREKRPTTAHSYEANAEAANLSPRTTEADHRRCQPLQPTNTIKLEFSNYAGVEVERKGQKSKNNKRYEFKWWGHHYMWKRVVEKHLDGVVSFHLIRDGESTPVAHIVPETRSPNQVEADEEAGGWVPPCYMWINDPSVIQAVTDVADVIIATGLVALVDDCIKERWQTPKVHHLPVLGDVERGGPRSFMQRVFSQRSTSSDRCHHSPTRYANPIAV